MKEINLSQTLYEITEAYPELIPVLAEEGFLGVTSEQMRTSHARVMKIPVGCQQLGIDLDGVVKRLEAEGYRVIGSEYLASPPPPPGFPPSRE